MRYTQANNCMKNEPKQGDYNYYTSVCNVCYAKGWHEKPEKCIRQYTQSCKECGSCQNGSMKQCKGTNVLRDYSDCATKFAPYYHKDTRIKVAFCNDKGEVYETKTGTVSMTTGIKPVFILMLRSNSTGISHTLSDNDKIIY